MSCLSGEARKGAWAPQGRAVLSTCLSRKTYCTCGSPLCCELLGEEQAPGHSESGTWWEEGLAGWQEGSQPGRKNLDPTLPILGYGAVCLRAVAVNKLLNHYHLT